MDKKRKVPGHRPAKLKRAREAENESASSAAPAPPPTPPVESSLAKLLIYQWSWGFISLVFLQKVAMAAVSDFTSQQATVPPELKVLAELGTSGTYPGNMYAEIKRHLPPSLLGMPVFVSMPLRVSKNLWEVISQAIIMPHILFAKIYHNYQEVWDTKICSGGRDAIENFWAAMLDHPIIDIVREREGGYLTNLIPLAMHSDDVPVTGVGKTWQKLISVFSWIFVYLFFFELAQLL